MYLVNRYYLQSQIVTLLDYFDFFFLIVIMSKNNTHVLLILDFSIGMSLLSFLRLEPTFAYYFLVYLLNMPEHNLKKLP